MATNEDQSGGTSSLIPHGRTSFETHPLYRERVEDWQLMEDCYAGARRIKDRNFHYLPATAAHHHDGLGLNDTGLRDYMAYKKRAVFHDVVNEAVQSMVGILHRKEPVITLPKRLEPMMEKATPDGESLASLLRKINEQQLLNARVGLLVEVPTGATVADTVPFIATYAARALINWDTGVSDQGERKIEMVALDESAWERYNLYSWRFEMKTRLLVSDPGELDASIAPAEPGYHVALMRDGKTKPVASDFTTPSIGGRTMDRVPFVFCNANDLVPDPETPPLLGLAEIALALYRADADYRQNLFMQGQDTLVLVGSLDGETTKKTGAGAIIDLPKGGTAMYVGVSAAGLTAQKEAIDTLEQMAGDRGSKLLDFQMAGRSSSSAASGAALKVRIAARTTTLTQIARTGAEALQEALRMCAEWVGCSQADVDSVKVEANTEFADGGLAGADMLAIMQAKQMGLPISTESIHALLVQNDITSMTYDDEQASIDDEKPLLGAGQVPIMGPDGQPMLHPVTGQPLTEPAPRRGIAGTNVAGKAPKVGPNGDKIDPRTGKPKSKAGAQAGNSGQAGQ